MKIAVISDLHLGRGDAADKFGHDEARFLSFLSFLEQNFEHIVLLGDIWETLTSTRPADATGELKRCREAHPAIASCFERRQYIYVHGNHDIVAGSVERAPGELLLDIGSTRLFFTHGHQQDLLIRRMRSLSEIGVWLGGWLLRLDLEPVYGFFDGLERIRSGVSATSIDCPFRRWALDVASHREADVVVTAHTHLAARSEDAGRLYLNSGSCSRGRFSYLGIDTSTGVYRVERGF